MHMFIPVTEESLDSQPTVKKKIWKHVELSYQTEAAPWQRL